jgi:NADH-ubiquinone oxidoreductase chain 6
MNIFMYLNVKSLIIELLIINAIVSAILVIISKNPVISVIFLISLVLNSALFLITKGMPFLGISYILVYLGAIIVLFLFVIMMINIKLTDILETGYQYTKNIPLALTVSGLFIYEIFNVLPSYFNSIYSYHGQATELPLDNSVILNLSKEIILTLNSFFNSRIFSSALLTHSPNNTLLEATINSNYALAIAPQDNHIFPLITNSNWPETLISSYTQIVSVAYNLYTYGAF